ncbi:TPA: hypothetical protein ACXH8Z_000120 [Neisseria meningitidis]
MTHKFKFGNRVIDNDMRLGECVVINASEKFVYIMNEQGDYNVLARPETLEIVPHPDTVRLDWLADKHNKIGSVLLPRECVEKHLDNMRDAIDAAMRLTESDNPK